MLEVVSRNISQEFDFFELHRKSPERYPALLESLGEGGNEQAKQEKSFDLLLALPQASLESRNRQLSASGWRTPADTDFFSALSQWQVREACEPVPRLPFCGGWFVLLGYEAAGLAEPGLTLPPAPPGLPDALAVRCAGAVIRNRTSGECFLVAESEAGAAQMQADIDALATLAGASQTNNAVPLCSTAISEDDPTVFLSGVHRVLDYLHAGDAYQVNLSRQWRATLNAADGYHVLYRRLRHHNPAPFAGLARWGNNTVLSSSPERLLRVEGGIVTTEPIAGTRPRLSPAQDAQMRDELHANLKESAEHLMLIDLERNDLGRVCQSGSVEVTELMQIHTYAHVHHIVSRLAGRLRPGTGAVEALAAMFPGGTITGCPKLRTMEIIAELEQTGRGAYTGSMGYLSRCGRMDMNILIRSFVCNGREISFRTGAGIVADSDPERELEETRAKAHGLLLALGAAA